MIFYNKLEINNDKDEIIKLSNESHLIGLFIADDNAFGKSYKEIYGNFVNEQNTKIENLLKNKIQNGIFDNNYRNKFNIQRITIK